MAILGFLERLAPLLLGAAALAAQAGPSPRPAAAPVRAHLAIARDVSPKSGPVCVRLTLESTAGRPLVLPRSAAVVPGFRGTEVPEFPDLVIVPALTDSQGRPVSRDSRDLLGTRTVVPGDFARLGPSASTVMAWDLTRYPWGYSFPREGRYTLKLRLYLVLPQWLARERKERSWLVTPEALTYLEAHRAELAGGWVETAPVAFQICVPGPRTPCLATPPDSQATPCAAGQPKKPKPKIP
ncbi:MAG: hypothetical protein ACJ76Y_14190 [Thermoanaerobaculia bacterium]